MQPTPVSPQTKTHRNLIENTFNLPRARLEGWFSSLKHGSYEILDIANAEYNCIAWAAGVTHVPWWPTPARSHPQYPEDWPEGVPRETTLAAFIQAFQTIGYSPCESHALEYRYEKVAIYSKPATGPTHAARLLRSGRWSSKIGIWELIEHDYEALTGHGPQEYGDVVQIMKRKKPLNRVLKDAIINILAPIIERLKR